MEQKTKEQEYKIIIKPSIARKLLKLGNPILDIKPHREFKSETVFIFEITEKFKNDLSELKKVNNKTK